MRRDEHEEHGENEAALGTSGWPCWRGLCEIFKLHDDAEN
jgi:hypothetical protein